MQSRADLMTENAVAALATAGAEEVWMGVESGSQKVLDAMEKGITIDQVEAATRRLRAAGIRAAWFLQLGYPGETWDDLQATAALVRRLRPDDVGISVAYPLPGTTFHEAVRAELHGKTHWNDSDDLAMMFEGTYRPELYRAVRDAIHLEVESFGTPSPTSEHEVRRAWREIERREPELRNPHPTRTRLVAAEP